jgi:hypothetical protein
VPSTLWAQYVKAAASPDVQHMSVAELQAFIRKVREGQGEGGTYMRDALSAAVTP